MPFFLGYGKLFIPRVSCIKTTEKSESLVSVFAIHFYKLQDQTCTVCSDRI